MKRFSKLFLIIFSLLYCGIFVACDLRAKYTEYQGKVIDEYPDWCCTYEKWGDITSGKSTGGSELNCFGYSEWIDWQSEDGKRLHDLIDNSVIPKSFSGKFRLLLEGQLLSIGFNDEKSSWDEFFAYIGSYTDYSKDRLVKIDINSDKVEYDCWLRRGSGYRSDFNDKCTEANKSNVLMTKIDDKSYRFVLSVAGTDVVDVILKNQSNAYGKAEIEKKYSWLPGSFTEVVGTDYWSNEYYGTESILFKYENDKIDVRFVDFCFEGISLRSVDEKNKKISFNLLDAEESDFADYIEIHILDENWTDCPKRGAIENNHLMKGTLGFYKEGDSTPVRFYDENHSEFSRLIE